MLLRIVFIKLALVVGVEERFGPGPELGVGFAEGVRLPHLDQELLLLTKLRVKLYVVLGGENGVVYNLVVYSIEKKLGMMENVLLRVIDEP